MKSSRRALLPRILKSAQLRRELFARAIVATQAREGINTTMPQALEAYDKVKKKKKEA